MPSRVPLRPSRPPRRPARRRLGLLGLALGGSAAAWPAAAWPGAALHAQQARVSVVDAGSGAAVGGALIALLDSGGSVLSEGLSIAGQPRLVVAPAPGTYRFRVRRVGTVAGESAPVALAAGETAELTLKAPATRVQVPAAHAAADRWCGGAPVRNSRGWVLWEEARKALLASQLSRADSLVALRARRYVRRPVGAQLNERTIREELRAEWPLPTRPPDALSREGYVDASGAALEAVAFYTPDEAALRSEEFARDHCFSVAEGEARFGLAFEPAPGRRVPDVRGTLWLDRASLALKSVEFTYANAPPAVRARDASGRVAFERLASGAWIVQEWSLRVPRLVRVGSGTSGALAQNGITEIGGEVLDAEDRVASAIGSTGTVRGIVYDSLVGAPLAGARVWLDNGAQAETDWRGLFELPDVPVGRRVAAFSHPALDSLGLTTLGADVRVAGGGRTWTELTTPSLTTLARAACGGAALAARRGIVFGRVLDAETDAPLAGASVRFAWTQVDTVERRRLVGAARLEPRVADRAIELTSDSTGAYYACDVPLGAVATARARHGAFSSGGTEVELGARRVAQRDVLVGRDSAGGRPVAAPAAVIASRDSAAVPAAAAPSAPRAGRAVVAGVVRDSLGRPRGGVRVTVDGTDGEAVTSETGRFAIPALPAGSRMVELRALGFAPVRVPVDLRARDTAHVAVVLRPVQTLRAVNVAATRGSKERERFAERKALGVGHFYSPEDLERNRPALTKSLFVTVPSAYVMSTSPAEFEILFPTPAPPGRCRAEVYIDGLEVDPTFLSVLSPGDIAAMEIYPRAQLVPPQMARKRRVCGAVFVWTKQYW